ncbi:hypothetical protein [Marinitenerispora sediminis]|uniref:Tetratricopeptide repeat protein n=1 Tax=Marinitenerispora sediminis TaxID=1931232 RepID=A0A368T2A8_9ACTN|nr:hypothetical protein [Marinitenerispora sediminis]RCV49034.1 hypothetical protein DEF28_21935 [Marinitenerispora sediminis]RCV51796.1 hypothetical protein DEF23_19825 [Marinitenerispora sediminis]RCV55414.1 hypothetical protein DEF24_17930 [Marinitenerispora sediminis]
MTDEDPTMRRIADAITLHREGDAEGARQRLAEIWVDISPDGDAFHRCVLAHYMADLQDDPRNELAWDIRALAAADASTDERVKQYHASLDLRGFYPSLHVNLADDYHRLGEEAKAREHLRQAQANAHMLRDDAYGDGIRSAMRRLATELGEPESA